MKRVNLSKSLILFTEDIDGGGDCRVIPGGYQRGNKSKIIEALEQKTPEMFGKIQNFSPKFKIYVFRLFLSKTNDNLPLKDDVIGDI